MSFTIEEEKKKLGLEKVTIEQGTQDIYERLVDAWVEKDGEQKYRVNFAYWPTRATVRHEWYHIFDGHLENEPDSGLAHSWQQTKAIVYATIGISLGRRIE